MLNETIVKAILKLTNMTLPVELTGELITFALLICFIGLSNLENHFPKVVRPTSQTKKSFQVNIGLFIFNSLLLSLCSVSTLYLIADHYSSFGLLSHMPNNAVKMTLSFLAFDLLLYVWHRICHNVDTLWVFHRVHHNDPYLNVSTAFRLHFVEILITNLLKALLIVLLGIDKTLVLMIEAFSTLWIMFHHTNISFKHERSLGCLLIVPSMHRTHHSADRNEHDSNYGAVFSTWDRLFGTLLELEPSKIGIHGNSPQDVFNLIKFGLGLGIPKPVAQAAQPVNLDRMIAEAAYYKAEKRNFRPGDDMRDWFEAKTEILNQVCGKKRCQGNSQSTWWGGFFSHS